MLISILPALQDRGVVVFQLWPSLAYNTRLAVSFGLIAAGLIVQAASSTLLVGLLLLAAGNLLLLVRGYDNRVDFGRYDPRAQWERVELDRLEDLVRLDRQMRRWDLSVLDVTNIAGGALFVLVAGLLGLAAWFLEGYPRILAIDAIVLLLPHWLTGVRRILTRPQLMTKVKTICYVIELFRRRLENHRVDLLALLTGGDTPVPEDVKFKVDIKDRHPDFLGLYGQVVLNEVQGTSYPYFYVVLVARQGYGLRRAFDRYDAPRGLTAEFKNQDKVEVLVLRQHTTKKSGYHTKPDATARILREGLELAESVAAAPAGNGRE